MFGSNNVTKAAKFLTSKCGVIPEKYAAYNGGFLFLAYAPNVKNKERVLNPYYLVDLKTRSAGPFSPAFDFAGFFEVVEKMKRL